MKVLLVVAAGIFFCLAVWNYGIDVDVILIAIKDGVLFFVGLFLFLICGFYGIVFKRRYGRFVTAQIENTLRIRASFLNLTVTKLILLLLGPCMAVHHYLALTERTQYWHWQYLHQALSESRVLPINLELEFGTVHFAYHLLLALIVVIVLKELRTKENG
jgi:hypothetical protein